MKQVFLLPFCSIRKNKGQSLSIMLSMVLSVALIVSVSCFMHSASTNKTESDREMYGDYHYYLLGDADFTNSILNKLGTEEYSIQNAKVFEIREVMEDADTFNLVLAYADSDCQSMIRREIIAGEYPGSVDEIAMDRYTLRSLDVEDKIGGEIDVRGRTFILSGIVKEPVEIDNDALEVFVSEDYEDTIGANIIYFKFDENWDLFNQVGAFTRTFDIDKESLESNGTLISGVIDSNAERLINTIKATSEEEGVNFTTILMKLQADFHLTSGIVSFLLAIFSIFIIYSIFDVSVSKRVKGYGILQTIGIGRNTIFFMLLIELLAMFLVSYPIGVLVGIGVDKLLFTSLGTLFSGKVSLVEKTHAGASVRDMVSLNTVTNEQFYIDWSVVVNCAFFLLALLILISFMLATKVRKKSVVELISHSPKRFRNGKIFSLKNKSLLSVLTNRFMFRRPGSFIGMVLSLAIGGIMIFAVNYIASNSRLNNEMVLHSDDSISSDIKVSMDEGNFDYGITEGQLENIGNLPSIADASGFKYFFGEIPISENQLKWKTYWAEIANAPNHKQLPEIMSRFNGVAIKSSQGYKIKTNIYGYDSDSLDKLKDYLLEGEIKQEEMNREETVILRTIVDAQNNTDGLDIHAGDMITIKVPKELNGDKVLLRFGNSEEQYEEKTFLVSAIVRKSLINNTEYIGNEGLDIIMTNEEMEKFYEIKNYNIITINKERENDTNTATQVQQLLSGTVNAQIMDNAVNIQTKNEEIKRSEMLLYSMAILLIVISLFHIVNTMFHLLNARRYAFAVLRAMGITENDFYKMLLKEALKYGISTCLAVYLIYFGIVQRSISNMLVHVYGYMNQLTVVSGFIRIAVVLGIMGTFLLSIGIPARKILKGNITQELKS